MYRFRPEHKIYARPIEDYPCKSIQAAAIMLMIQNNLNKGAIFFFLFLIHEKNNSY